MHSDQTRGLLSQLAGSWADTGELEFPTIECAPCREELERRSLRDAWPLHYLQQTWKATSGGEAPSDVEAGFIAVTAEGAVEVVNARDPDRVEVLRGAIGELGKMSRRLGLAADLFGHDARMDDAVRSLEVDGNRSPSGHDRSSVGNAGTSAMTHRKGDTPGHGQRS